MPSGPQQFAPNYTTKDFIVEYVKVWVKNRINEKSTLFGIAALVLTLANDPQVFTSLQGLYSAAKGGGNTVAITSAVVSFLLIVLRERHTIDESAAAKFNATKA